MSIEIKWLAVAGVTIISGVALAIYFWTKNQKQSLKEDEFPDPFKPIYHVNDPPVPPNFVPKSLPHVDQLKAVLSSEDAVIYTQFDGDLYHLNRSCWNKDIMGFPALIVSVKNAKAVSEVVTFAAKHKYDIAVASGRHSTKCMVTNSIVVDLSLMREVKVDPEKMTVECGGGCKLGQIDFACKKYDIAVPAGHNYDTGVGGLATAAGVGFLTRKFGMTIDCILAVEIVLANGDIVWVEEGDEKYEDLFWAVRGAASNFGIVTKFKFKAFKIPPRVMVSTFVYPDVPKCMYFLFQDPKVMLKKWITETDSMANDECLMIVMPGNGPLIVVWSHCGDLEEGKKVFEQRKKKFWSPIIDAKPMNYHLGLQRIGLGPNQDQQTPCYFYETSALLKTPVSDELADEVWKATHGANFSSDDSIVFQLVGGKQLEVKPEDTAFWKRNSNIWALVLSMWNIKENEKEGVRQKHVDWARAQKVLFQKHKASAYAPVLGDVDEDVEGIEGAYGGNYDRLRKIKAKYDPDNVFHLNRNIVPA